MRIDHKISGYTLLEILIALSVFSILSLITSSLLIKITDSYKTIVNHCEQLAKLQFSLTFMEQSIREATNRPVNSDTLQAPFIGHNNMIEFTRGGIDNYNGENKRSTLQRIAFLCNENKLVYRNWSVLDAKERVFTEEILLNNLSQCNFAFLNNKKEILNVWDSYIITSTKPQDNLPLAVQFNLELQKNKDMSLLYIIPESLYG